MGYEMKSLERDLWSALKAKQPAAPVTYQVLDQYGPRDQVVVYNGPDIYEALQKAKDRHRLANRLITLYRNGNLFLKWERVEKSQRLWWKDTYNGANFL